MVHERHNICPPIDDVVLHYPSIRRLPKHQFSCDCQVYINLIIPTLSRAPSCIVVQVLMFIRCVIPNIFHELHIIIPSTDACCGASRAISFFEIYVVVAEVPMLVADQIHHAVSHVMRLANGVYRDRHFAVTTRAHDGC